VRTTTEVWVYAEQHNGKLADISLELISKGRELADILSARLASVIIGSNIEHLAAETIAYGCDVVYIADDPRLKAYTVLPYARVIGNLVKEYSPNIILYGATSTGRDLAPRIASRVKAGLTADCTGFAIQDYLEPQSKKLFSNLLMQIRPAFGGNIMATIVNPEMHPQMATVREGVMRIRTPDYSRQGNIIKVDVKLEPGDSVTCVLESVKVEKSVNLKEARIIVSGGIGIGSKENFSLIHDFAKAIGGTVGASRAAVDAGFIPRDHQVGQTGTTVRPKLYIAAGISGAVQHRAGMAESNKIIAINSDPNAPIFEIAHYGIVGDLNEVIPKFIKAFKEK